MEGIPDQGRLSGSSTVGVRIVNAPEEWNCLVREDEQAELTVKCKERLNAPVKEGEAVGEIILTLEGETLEKWELVTADRIEKRDFRWCMRRIAEEYIKIDQEK